MPKQLSDEVKNQISLDAAKMTGSRTSISEILAKKYKCSSITARSYMDKGALYLRRNVPITISEENQIRVAYNECEEPIKADRLRKVAHEFNRSEGAVRKIIKTGVDLHLETEKMFDYKQDFI